MIMQTTQENITGAPRCWLDLLPSEIRSAVASRVCKPQYSDASLYLAQTSQEQEDAVVGILSNKLNLNAIAASWNKEGIEWVKIFNGKVHNIELKNAIPPSSFLSLRPYVKDLFSSPFLFRAEIPDETSFIAAISGLSSLRELKVIGKDGAPENAIDLLESLKTLDLSKLEIECQAVSHNRCAIHGSSFWNDLVQALPEHCPNLHTFRMQSTPPSLNDSKTVWNMLPRLKALRHVTIDQTPPLVAFDTLRKLESVFVRIDTQGGVSGAREISRSVTGLGSNSCLRGGHIDVLSHFCRLQELDLKVFPGTEHRLLASVQTMPELRSLSLKWGLAPISLSRERILESIRSAILLSIVRRIPKLEKVEFLFVRIDSGDLREMLMCVGKRLRHFGMSVHRPLKTLYVKLKIFLWALYTYNPNVESVNICPPSFHDPRLNPLPPSSLSTILSEKEKRNLMMVLNRLQCRIPALDLC